MGGREVSIVTRDDFDISLQKGGSGQYAQASGRNKLEEAFAQFADSLFLPDGHQHAFSGNLLKLIDCPLCGGTGFTVCFAKYHMNICQCHSCHFIYANPIIATEVYDALHLESQILSDHHVNFIQSPMYRYYSSLRYRYELQLIKTFSRQAALTLLDIGCSTGGFVETAAEMGFNATGIEANREAARIAQDQGLSVIHGMFGKTDLPLATFDVVVCLDVLEHVENPKRFLVEIRDVMNRDSLLFLQVPNVFSLIVLLEQEKNQIYNGLIHLNYFSPCSLASLARGAGLETVHVETVLSELGKVQTHAAEEIRRCLQPYHIASPEELTANWIHDNLLGYKILGLFRLPRG